MNSKHPFCSRENAIYSLTEGVGHEVVNKINSERYHDDSLQLCTHDSFLIYSSRPLFFFITYLFIVYSKHWLKLMVSAGFKRGTEGAK